MMFPLVTDLAADGVPVAVSCGVLKFSRQAYYAWLADPVSDRDLVDAYAINAALDVHADDPGLGYRFIADELAAAGLTGWNRRETILATGLTAVLNITLIIHLVSLSGSIILSLDKGVAMLRVTIFAVTLFISSPARN